MTRDAAISYLEPMAENAKYESYREALDMAIAALREQEERRWIPVTERLPEDGETVLTYKNGIFEVQVYEKKRNGWISWQGNWFWSMATVSHWMPLPEPPKEV